MASSSFTYNSQLVSYLFALYQFHHAEPGMEDAFTLYHKVQESPRSTRSSSASPALPALGHALAGSMATASTKLLLYPLELIITRLQVQRQFHGPKEAPSAAQDADAEYKDLVDAARKIYKYEGGLKAFYTACGPDVGKGIADGFLFFLAYTFLRQQQLTRDGTKNLSVSKELSVGVAAGAFAKLLTTPIQNIVTRQQTAALVAARDPTSSTTPSQSRKLTIKDIALQIRAERGIQGFWAGYSASVLLTLNPALTFAIDNLLRRLLPSSRRLNPPPQLTFLLAAISKAIATTVTYPIMLAKSRAQVSSPTTSITEEEGTEKTDVPSLQHPPSESSRRRQILQTAHKALRLLSAQYAIFLSLQKIYRAEGLSGLYSGLEAEVLKGFLSHGLTMVVKEKVHVGVIQLYYLLMSFVRRWPADLDQARQDAGSVAAEAKERAGSVAIEARERAGTVAAEAKERAGNVSVTISEGTKQLVEEGKKVVGGE